jgi:hypothetical protein
MVSMDNYSFYPNGSSVLDPAMAYTWFRQILREQLVVTTILLKDQFFDFLQQ